MNPTQEINNTLKEIYSIIYGKAKATIADDQHEAMMRSFAFLKEYKCNKVIYGINTGFGPMAQYRIDDSQLTELQYNIIRSHCCGAGEPLAREYVRAAMAARMQTFVSGHSAVHPDTVALIAEFLNHDIIPYVPQHGSVGASGDLVQLSHIALTLIGEGEVYFEGKLVPTPIAMKACGLSPLKLRIREGLAITNGTAVMTGIGLVNLLHAKALLHWSTLASVMMNEIAGSYDDFMSETLNALKGHQAQNTIANKMRKIAASSSRLKQRFHSDIDAQAEQEKIFTHKVQPYYSLRCTPQILGPVLEAIEQCERILIEEYYSVDDNPIIDPATATVYHGGNFHGDYVSFEMDKLKIAVTKMTMLAERQLNYLFHDRINGILPPFVNLGKLGLNYGLQAAQFTATSTTAESQTLSNPMYVHSIPNNNDNQDIVSMGTNAALITQRVIDNAYQVIAIQMMALVQAVDCLMISDHLAEQTRVLYDEIRTIIPTFVDDSTKHKEIADIVTYLKRAQ